jgi:hypothetical protein
MAKTFNQFTKKIDELYWPKAGDEAKFMAMHGPYDAADVGGKETHDDAVFKGTIVQKDHTKLAPSSEELPDGQSELNDLVKNIHSRDTDELLKTVSHLNLSTDPKHREHRDVINKELMYRYKNHSMSEELIGGQKNLDVDPDGRLTAKDFAILRARKNKNKKKMNEELGFKPVKVTVGPYVGNQYDQGGGHHVIAHGPNGEKKNVNQWPTDKTSAEQSAAATAKEHGLKPDKSKPYGHFIENEELDEGKLGNAFKKGMQRYKGKSKSPLISAGIHAFQTLRAAKAAKMSNANPNNFDKFMDYANKRNQVREEAEVEEGVSVNGQRVGGYGGNRSPLRFLKKTPAEKARNKAGFDAVTKIIDKMNAPGGINSPERSAEIDADLKKKRNAELTAAGRKPLPESDTKSHKIAKAIMNKEEVNFNTEEIELDDGNVIEIDIELAEAIADLFDSLDEDDQDALAEMLHTDIDSFMEVVDLLENDGE